MSGKSHRSPRLERADSVETIVPDAGASNQFMQELMALDRSSTPRAPSALDLARDQAPARRRGEDPAPSAGFRAPEPIADETDAHAAAAASVKGRGQLVPVMGLRDDNDAAGVDGYSEEDKRRAQAAYDAVDGALDPRFTQRPS